MATMKDFFRHCITTSNPMLDEVATADSIHSISEFFTGFYMGDADCDSYSDEE